MRTVKELKQEIDKIMKPGYTYKINLSYSEHLIDISNGLGVGVKLVQIEDKLVYKFIVDLQFLRSQELTYDELELCKDIIEILEKNRSFVLRRLKKYTIEEYEREQIAFQKRQEELIKFFESIIYKDKLSEEDDIYEY